MFNKHSAETTMRELDFEEVIDQELVKRVIVIVAVKGASQKRTKTRA